MLSIKQLNDVVLDLVWLKIQILQPVLYTVMASLLTYFLVFNQAKTKLLSQKKYERLSKSRGALKIGPMFSLKFEVN